MAPSAAGLADPGGFRDSGARCQEMENMNEDLIVQRRDGLIQAEVDGELVALHIDKGTCYGFNVTATRIWTLIESPRRVSELRDQLVDEYDVDAETCGLEVMAVLKDLERDGLVELQPAPATN